MCFSAPASFAASAGLFTLGIIAVSRARKSPYRFFAAIPFIFSVQQFCEGLLWLSLHHPALSRWHPVAMYAFLLFAQVVWPSYVPISLMLPEKNPLRKKILRLLFGIGLATSSSLLFFLFSYPVTAVATAGHIRYELHFPGHLYWLIGLCYLVAAILSPFVSSVKRIWIFGVILLVSYLVSRMFFYDHLVSVWCYFAAVFSLLLLFLIPAKSPDFPRQG